MDVGCPQCQTEYELDDDRVGEDGVTVKCTSCGHVFRVKKKQLVVTLPARGGEAPNTPLGPSASFGDLPPATANREWKVRQATGNVFTCRDLTILQKWIIEGKVVRDDEISLTGETWKRLGNIPELASFFQIVEEAAKARALEALHRTTSGSVPAVAPKKITDTWRGGQFGQPESSPSDETIRHDPSRRDTPKEYPAAEPPPAEPPPPEPPPAPKAQSQTLQGPRFSTPAPAPAAKEPETLPPEPPPKRKETLRGPQFATPAPAEAPPPLTETLKGGRFSAPVPRPNRDEPSDEELTRAVKGGGGGKWAVLILLGLAVGGGVGWYFGVYEPEQRKLAEQRQKDEAARQEAERLSAQRALEAKPPEVPVVLDASVEDAPDAGTAEASDAGAAVDAGTAPAADAGTTSASVASDAGAGPAPVVDAGALPVAAADGGVGAPVVLEQKRSFDWYLAQGERLRDREKPEQALDMYSKAMELKPERVEPWAGKGLALLDMANPSGAAEAFLQALKYGPRYGPAIMGLAEAYRMMGKNEKAIQYYERYLEVLPNGSEAPVAKNSIERLKGQ